MKRWFHVWQKTDSNTLVWGFSATNDIIDPKFPEWKMIGKKLQDSREWFIENNCEVVEIKTNVS